MYYTLKRLYLAGQITEAQLLKAVKNKYITAEQKDQIISAKK